MSLHPLGELQALEGSANPQVSCASKEDVLASTSQNPSLPGVKSREPEGSANPQVHQAYNQVSDGSMQHPHKKIKIWEPQPQQYTSKLARKKAKIQRKLSRDCSLLFHIVSVSVSISNMNSNPRVILPQLGPSPCNVITTTGGVPQFILNNSTFTKPTDTVFITLSSIITDLYQMALHRPDGTKNGNLLNGSMRGIGFRQGTDRGSSGGIYARIPNLSKEATILDDTLWNKLQNHNDFIAERIHLLSQTAWSQNHQLSTAHSIPNWSQKEWREVKNEHNFAGNVMVTFNDFYNQVHQDKHDLNPWTYGIFTYINKKTGVPIPPPSKALGHGLIFPCHSCRIDFAHANGIVEVLWQTTKFEHGTTCPPLSLSTNDIFTHFGCSFQINKKLLVTASKLKCTSDDIVLEKTLCKSKKYG